MPGLDDTTIGSLIAELEGLRERALDAERALPLEALASRHRPSAANLAHYLTLRRTDLRELQQRLARAGLSSLGRNEAHVLAGIESVLGILWRLTGKQGPEQAARIDFDWGEELLRENANQLLGDPRERLGRIMVTMPIEASADAELVETLVQKGMDLMRINCAHDDADAWLRMVKNLERAQERTGRSCLVYADLAGPKLRTVLGNEQEVHVRPGEKLLLQSSLLAGHAKHELKRIGCTLPEAVAAIQPGHRVFFDDGKVACLARERVGDAVQLEVLSTPHEHAKIKDEVGINLPDTWIETDCLTAKDHGDLDFIAAHADLVGLSFVRHPADVQQLLSELERRDARHLGIVLKIETDKAFRALPQLLLAALAAERCGVMVARGDLAIEVGFERLAEVQEEILWICEAAHVPVIWATQVLEHLAKKGLPSRAEVTDAAMAGRAECVMLNKGPHIVEALAFLDDVLRRMQEHQHKRRTLLRRLSVAG